jgi:hypothetical protein
MRRSATKAPRGSVSLKHGCVPPIYFNCEKPDKTVKSQINMRHGFAGKAIRGTTYVKFDLQLRVVGPGQSDEALLLGPLTAV